MARNFFQLQQFNPGNSQIDFSAPMNALEGLRQQNNLQAQVKRQQEEQTYQRGRDARQDARQDETWKVENLERLGKSAFAYSQLPPDKRDPATWGRIVKSMQAFDPSIGGDPDDIDPVSGPAKFAAVYAGQVRDPREDKLMDLKLRGAERDLLKPIGGEAPSNVREWEYYSRLSPEQQQQYLAMKRTQQTLDLGDRFAITNQTQPGAVAAEIPKNLQETERQKVVGRETGERQANSGKALAALQSADEKSSILVDTVTRAKALVGPMTTGAGALLSNIPGTSARDLSALTDTLKANAGFQELQTMRDNSPTGGALGQVAVQELAMLQATVTSLDQAQTPEQFMQALNNFEQFVVGSKERRRAAYEQDKARFGAAAVPNPDAGGGDGWTEIDGVRIREKR
jgi:hypothetical protein